MPRCALPMFGQLCEGAAVSVADGEVFADPALTAVVVTPPDVAEGVCEVAALATARLAPNPTASAPAPTAAPMMILPRLAFNVSASWRLDGDPGARRPAVDPELLQ